MNPIYFIGWSFYRIAFKFYFGWRVYHRDRVPLKGGVIIASNHASFLDPPLVGSSLSRDVHYFGRKSLFRNPLVAWVLKYMNSVPLDRDGGGGSGLKIIIERLEDGAAILLFPEGTRTQDGQLQPVRAGIGLTVIKTTAPVVPVRVFGTFEAWGRGGGLPKPLRVAIKFAKPMDFAALRAEAKTCSKQRLKEIYQQVADEIMAEIGRLEPVAD